MFTGDDEGVRAALGCCLMLVGIVVVGTLGFHLVEPTWTFWECFYFTIVTITTVGYGDQGLTVNGQMFAAIIMVGGLGVFTYSLTTLIRIASDSEAASRRKMKREIAKCSGHTVVCGYGRMGRTICQEIAEKGGTCVVIECDEDNIERAHADHRLVIDGVASDDESLLRAGIVRAKGVVCAVDSDAENMFITVTARDLNPACTVISRAESESAARKLERAGATLVVSPHQMAGETVATALMHPRLAKFMKCNGGEGRAFELGETEVESGASLSGKTVQEFGHTVHSLVFVAIERATGDLIVRPGGNDVFQEGDVVIYAGSVQDASVIKKAAATELVTA